MFDELTLCVYWMNIIILCITASLSYENYENASNSCELRFLNIIDFCVQYKMIDLWF